ncbi:glucosaminidase domain-containing protein [uncultured Kriegella sp.]|uniref:glucosaminidase domain-containing protein n=1 Tax=uncultured Kriegella sp. TaxID=1798910 RepID=UPI0030DD154E|tara:strand:+ start:26158 stop:27018 length:861 start_codon:yes stop_codon:yes gene_type:complete
MTKKLIVTLVLGIFLIGCKAKKKTTYNKSHKETTPTVVAEPQDKTPKQNTDYPFPEDNGRFQKFPIANVDQYIETFAEIAQFEMKAYGIPASITLAQGMLESGFGKGALAVKTNNHFGIKCHTGWQGDFDHHDDDEKGECFRKYNHPMYSYRDHSIFLTTRSRYSFLFDLRTDDYKGWAKGLRQAGYATDKRYPHKLIALIERYDLGQYDKAVINQGYGRKHEVIAKNSKITGQENRVHVVKKGDTLYSLSKRYQVSVDQLKRWNYMMGNTISIGQKLTVKTESYN